MKPLWTLVFLLLALQRSMAQVPAVDSNFILQFQKSGDVSHAHDTTQLSENRLFYLVKFKNPITAKIKDSYQIIRELSERYAIVSLPLKALEHEGLNDFEFIKPANDLWKLPSGNGNFLSRNESIFKWFIAPLNRRDFLQLIQDIGARIIQDDASSNSLLIELKNPTDIKLLITSASVKFLQPLSLTPHEELVINGFDLSTNRVNLVHHKFSGINGTGLVVSVNENKFDSTDIDFKGRYIPTGLSSSLVTGHASIMATMMAGAGNSYYLGQGVAWNSKLVSVDFSTLLPQPNSFYQQFKVSVENHSYGTGIENFYGTDAAAYDANVNSNSSLVHVFSSGNSGTTTSTAGKYAGVENFANLTGSFKMAKNIITVGATDSFNNVELLSSRGPAFDGRIKPDLVAFGQDGSSGAAAMVSGTALLMQQAYKIQHQDSLPPASLIRAALINSADEIGNAGPDYVSGYGALNADAAVETIINGRYLLNAISNQNAQTYSLSIPANIQRVKVTLAYTDVPSQPNSFKALINDLDLDLKNMSTGQEWKPWVLSTAANKDSLSLGARRDRDSLNNVEQVSIDLPSAGQYEIKVTGYQVTNSSQQYSVVYQLDTLNHFEWDYPRRNDAVVGGTQAALRWHQSFGGNGILEYSLNKGNSWQVITPAVNLTQAFFKWNLPDTFATALLRMTINAQQFVSDTFVISQKIQMRVGSNCEDSILLDWNHVEHADEYQVFVLSSNFLQPLTKTGDTSFVFFKHDANSKYFTVAPIKENREGIKAFTINYETQGIGCYIKSFLAQLLADKASIVFELGTLYQIKQIDIEKDDAYSFTSVQTFDHPSQLSYQTQIGNLHQGVNIFRLKITLQDGRKIYSQEELVYYTGNKDFIVYPNPVLRGQSIIILRNNLDEATMVLYDSYGRKMQQLSLQDILNPVNTTFLQKGIYIIVIFDKNQTRIFQQKVIVQ